MAVIHPTALDTETALVTVQRPVAKLVSVAVAGSLGRALVPQHHRDQVTKLYQGALQTGLAGHMAPYDLLTGLVWSEGALLRDVIEAYEADRVFDTMTRQKLLNFARGIRNAKYNLGAVAELYGLEVDKNDPWRTRYAELLGLEIEQWPAAAIAYAQRDADITLAVWYWQEAAAAQLEDALGLPPGQIFGTAGVHARAHINLYQQTVIGFRTDPERVAELVARVNAEIEALGRQVVAAGLARIGGTKKAPRLVASAAATAAMVQRYCTERQIPVPLTEKKRVSVSQDALNELDIPKGHPLDALRRWKSRRSLATQRLPALQRPTWRTRYDECKVTSRTGANGPQGRRKPEKWTPYEWTGGNGQNWPREPGWRECLVPPPGHVFVVSDFSGAELVAWAQFQLRLFGSSRLATVLADPSRDVHRETAATIFDKLPEYITKEERQLGKPTMFGFMGGLGPDSAVTFFARDPYGLTITTNDARRYKHGWLHTWPEADPTLKWVGRQAGWDGKITMAHPITGFVRGGMFYTEAANFTFQHTAAIGAKIALWRLFKAQYEPGPLQGCPQVLFVHDENVTQCPIDRAEEVKAAKDRIMIESFAEVCPDVPVRVESSIVECYTK